MNETVKVIGGGASLRIAYLTGSFPHISETFVVNQIAGMAARGQEVDIFTTIPGRGGDLPPGVQRYGLSERTFYLFCAPRNLARALIALANLARWGWHMPQIALRALNVLRYGRSAASLSLVCAALTLSRRSAKKYDLVHCQFGTLGELALRLMEIGCLAGKLVVSFRGFDATKHLRANPRAYEELFRRADLVLPVSEALARHLIDAGCDRSKIIVHHSGIELAKFPYSVRTRPDAKTTELLSVSRLSEKKGLEYAIRAVAQIISEGRAVTYSIVGEGPLRSELQLLIDKLGVNKQVRLMGWCPHNEVVALLGRAHILLAPSVTAADGDEEGIPNAVKEAMAMGMPVISTRHGGIPELVEDGVSGFLVAERDSGALANRLLHLIDHPELWAVIGRAARDRVEALFDIERLNDELVTMYRKLVHGAAAQPRSALGAEATVGT